MIDSAMSSKEKARIKAVTSYQSGAWLNALPVASLGSLLDNQSFRIAIGLRLGSPICVPDTCKCGASVDAKGTHGLSCKFSAGRQSRHHAVNDLLKRALTTANIPSILEPTGVSRDDGNRPDGMTLIPWKFGKPVVWDFTCVDTVATSHVAASSNCPGAAAVNGEKTKSRKYQNLQQLYIFYPVAVETFGVFGPNALEFIKEIGRRITEVTCDRRATSFLFQRISIAIQRGNAASVMGTIPLSRHLNELFLNPQRRLFSFVRSDKSPGEVLDSDLSTFSKITRSAFSTPNSTSSSINRSSHSQRYSESKIYRFGHLPDKDRSRYSIGKVGLNNLGNTCYMNSVLQALFMTKTFRNEVLLYNKDMPPLLSKMQVLFALLQYSKKCSLSPADILNSSRHPGFLPGHQHDSSEFLGYLLDTLHEQEKNLNDIGDSVEEAGAAAPSIIPTCVQQSFGGRTFTISRCGDCYTQSERADHSRELQLSFRDRSNNQSVQTLLDYYLQPERLCGENQYMCDVCERLTDGERVTSIVEAPARLILTLKQFRYDPTSHQLTKLLQEVKLDQHIHLDQYQYELYAAVVHCGSNVDSGHYYTFARDKTEWYKFNDCSVMKSTPEDLRRLNPPEAPYILFYSRQDVCEPEALPFAVLSGRLQIALTKDQSEYEFDKRQLSLNFHRQNRDDFPPPPGCSGGGFSAVTDSRAYDSFISK